MAEYYSKYGGPDFTNLLEKYNNYTNIINSIGDYIVEQGYDSATEFYYNKWNSGICEAYTEKGVSLTYSSQVYGGYYYYAGVGLPANLFTQVDVINYSAHMNNGFALCGTQLTISTSSVTCYFVTNQSGLSTANVFLRVLGHWK